MKSIKTDSTFKPARDVDRNFDKYFRSFFLSFDGSFYKKNCKGKSSITAVVELLSFNSDTIARDPSFYLVSESSGDGQRQIKAFKTNIVGKQAII